MNGFVKALKESPNCFLLEGTPVTSIDYTNPSEIFVTAEVSNTTFKKYCGKKVILTPGAYVNHALSTLCPSFLQKINCTIYLWSSTYFKIKQSSSPSTPRVWPTWYFIGLQKEVSGANQPLDANAYYGFPSEDGSDFVRVAPAFTSQPEFDYHLYPPPVEERKVDLASLRFTADFVEKSMGELNPARLPEQDSTCIAGFAEMTVKNENKEKEVGSAGFVLDFVPNTNNRIILTAGGWGMKYVPLMGILLARLAIDGQASPEYREDIEPMKIDRGILISADEESEEKKERLSVADFSCSQRATKFHKLWS